MTTTPQNPTPRTTAFAKALGVIYAKSYSADYKTVYFAEEAQKLIDEQVATIERELITTKQLAERYEYVRRLNPTSFASLFTQNIRTGKHFDDIVDDAINQAKGKQ